MHKNECIDQKCIRGISLAAPEDMVVIALYQMVKITVSPYLGGLAPAAKAAT